ncbi:MAG: patatin family protein [Ruminococcus sp.]|nr:patatin family protein [Ruminococcus sp.]
MENTYKKGLVLEGGAMRGLFTAGVLDIFLENDVRFDGMAGISAGAVFGCNLKTRQIGRAIRYNKRFCRDKRYCSFRSLIMTGDLYGVKFCYDVIPKQLDVMDTKTFAADPLKFYIGATDVATGKAVYHLCSDGGKRDMQWMRASASMPMASRPVNIGGRKLLDGGISDSIPFAFMERQGYNRNVIILTQPEGYVKKPAGAGARLMFRLGLHRYPKIAEAMIRRSDMYNEQIRQIREREEAGSILVIRPHESLGISRTERDPEELERVYQTGRQVGLERLAEIKAFLEED